MIVTTSQSIEGHQVKEYLGIVSGEIIIGANVIRDFFASIRDFFGGRSGSYERVFLKARETSLNQLQDTAKKLGADAVIATDFYYETVGKNGSMLMVAVTGTAVKISQDHYPPITPL